jgi:hypothetical protein
MADPPHLSSNDAGAPAGQSAPPSPPGSPFSQDKRPGWPFLAAGVILPLVTLVFELETRMCASNLFDPMPTIWHVLLVAFVPLANFWLWYALRQQPNSHSKFLGMANSIAICVSFVYALVFLPVLPFAVIATIVFGLGLLAMAPLFAFIAAVRGHVYLRRFGGHTRFWRVPGTMLGGVVFLIIVFLIELPVTGTRVCMNVACSDNPDTRAGAIRLLRLVGNEDVMLRLCYWRSGRFMDPLGMLTARAAQIQPEQAREVFFRVKGIPYNAVPPPSGIRGYGRRALLESMDFDFDQGGQSVGGRVKGLSLDVSRLDGSIDAEAALAYLEWTLQFKNESARPQEARAQIALPPGGVVSRVTLWVDGEEREAAFAGRAKVREAYQRIVSRQRDPLLVTTSGPDRVMVQCFPVPPKSGLIKIRIGITAPLTLVDRERGWLRLPCLAERNFRIDNQQRHLVWVESKTPISSKSQEWLQETTSDGRFALRAELTEQALMKAASSIEAARSAGTVQAWAEDPFAEQARVVVQTIEEKPGTSPKRVILVVDGSYGMGNFIPEITDALVSIPGGISISTIVAADRPVEIPECSTTEPNAIRTGVIASLLNRTYEGGCDNAPSLVRAWKLASTHPDAVIVWLHGAQPLLMEKPELMRQEWERRGRGPTLWSVEITPGPDRTLKELDGIGSVVTLPRLGSLKEDLERLFTSWQDGRSVLVCQRHSQDKPPEGEVLSGRHTSAHLVKLWANDEIRLLSASRATSAREDAVRTAGLYQLVTPVSGAVVLETAQQYKQAGLEPTDPAKVPTIPEPATWLLILIVAAILVWVARRKRRSWTAS